MKLRVVLVLLWLIAVAVGNLSAADDNCVSCHQDFEDEDGPSHIITKDIHFQKGIGCADCHGGDPLLEDMDNVRESRGWRGVPSHLQVPGFCARCHSDAAYMHEHNPTLPTDQLAKYKTSTHGRLLFENNDTKVANCISCHTVHQIGDAKMPHSSTHPLRISRTCGRCHSDPSHMADYDIPINQVLDYSVSVHGKALLERKDLGAPSCNDCHGNHGAAPPGVESLAAVCGNCHTLEAELYSASTHAEEFRKRGYPMCVTCHSNHNIVKPFDALVGTEEPALCVACHNRVDGTIGFETAAGISDAIGELVRKSSEAREVLSRAIKMGMLTTDEEFRLKEVDQALIQTRTLVHSFNLDSVLPRAQDGLEKADLVIVNSEALIGEYHFRRQGLGLATMFITLLVIGLWIKIRRIGI